MKKNQIILSLSTIVVAGVLALTSCSKDDTTGPVITVTGDSNIELPLGSSYTDANATANDDEDGAVTVSSDASSTNPNVNHTGTYTITYTAQDKAGNVSTETRTVVIYNEAEVFAGHYGNSVDSCLLTPPSAFDADIEVSDSINHLVKITGFGAYGPTVTVFATINGNTTGSTINVETGQSLGGSAQITSKYLSESLVISGSASSTSTFKIKYGWTDGANNDVCKSYYIR